MKPPIALTRLLCVLAVALAACTVEPTPTADGVAATPLVILISIDGFRPDYLQRGVTPNLNAIAAAGVRAEAMLPSFPSATFPNHYTLVTGLRPDHHGIVGNTIEDANIPERRFRPETDAAVSDRRWWDEAEPIWVTAEDHHVRSATMFWPGSEAAIHGVRPSLWMHYDKQVPAEARVDAVLGWIDQPVPPRFVTLYFDDVDTAGHHAGPDSHEVTEAAEKVDRAIGRLEEGLVARHRRVDLVIVSDHGMAGVSSERVVRLDRIAPAGSYRWILGGTYAGVEATAGHEPELAEALLAPHDHMACWRKADIPARLAYGKNARVPPFVCLAEPGWVVLDGPPKDKPDLGAHGYDNQAVEMRATFIAEGPDFRAGTTIPIFDNVDVYPLVMRLLGLAPLPNDGTVATFAAVLR